VKILGHRVELGEIEAQVRRASGSDAVVAMGWPVNPGGADGIEVFVQAETAPIDLIMKELKTALPPYMVPRNIRVLPRFPLNASGKFDRNAIRRLLESGT
jgi:acyl-coenzyme A synthetase/AMP-(fatty) acid ligase